MQVQVLAPDHQVRIGPLLPVGHDEPERFVERQDVVERPAREDRVRALTGHERTLLSGGG